MMRKLNIASWGLLLEVIGQSALCDDLLPGIPSWMFSAVLLPPWLTIYAIAPQPSVVPGWLG
jgi:hypothetical protein